MLEDLNVFWTLRRSSISIWLTISWILQSSNLFTVTFLLDSSLTLTHPIPKWEILTSKNDLWIHFMQHSNIGMSTGSLKCVYNIISLKCYIMSKNYHFLTSMWEIYERSRRPAQFENKWNVLIFLVNFHDNGLYFDIVSLHTLDLLKSWRTKGLKIILASMWAISHVYVRFSHRREISHLCEISLTDMYYTIICFIILALT